jgi:alkylation response protein AidB-like acyl-CoA dehydrogenase
MFNFITDEQRLIAESARNLFEDLAAADSALRQTTHSRLEGERVRRGLSELGVFGTSPDDEAMASALVQSAIAREAGAVCLPYPVLESLAAHAVMMGTSKSRDFQQQGHRLTMPIVEAAVGSECSLKEGRVTGVARLVPFADTTEGLLLPARGARGDVLVSVVFTAADVDRKPRATVEPDYPLHDVTCAQVPVSMELAVLDSGESAPVALRQRCSLLAAAEISGTCRNMVNMTRDYLVTRTQFGAPLGSNQALKHALADALVKVEAMNAIVNYAAAAADARSADAAASILAAKMFAGRAGKEIADSMLQLHGAIGYTMEYPLQLFMRRVYRLGIAHGSPRVQAGQLYESFAA